jgi:restriction system protein
MTTPKHAWMVRAGDNNELADVIEKNKAVAIGWAKMSDVSSLRTRDDFKEAYRKAYPEEAENKVAGAAGQIYRFVREIHKGDYVLSYQKASRELLIGICEGEHEYSTKLFSNYYPQIRRVNWLNRVSRDNFSEPARNSLGSSLTIFQVDEHLPEIDRLATTKPGVPPKAPVEVEPAPPFHTEVEAKADELIADLISKLDGYDFQDLVAAVLRAMNLRATSKPPGADRGVDIVAHPDALGFGRPRIKVQVKHRKGPASGPDMRSFRGALQGDNGLFVSTGGFTKDAETEAQQSPPITCLDRDGFLELLVEHYEAMEPEFKAKVPLRKIWVPTM